MSEDKISEGIRELVIARLEVMPANYKLSIGSEGTFTKEEIIQHVLRGDKIGNQIVQMQVNFINALKTGKLLEAINQNG